MILSGLKDSQTFLAQYYSFSLQKVQEAKITLCISLSSPADYLARGWTPPSSSAGSTSNPTANNHWNVSCCPKALESAWQPANVFS